MSSDRRHSIVFLFAAALWASLASGPAQAADKAKVFKAGAYAQDITPVFPTTVNGGMSDRIATRANDPLHARCVVLDDGTTKLAIVVCDSCMIPREVFDRAKKAIHKATGIPTQNMMMSATHTHSAPTSGGVFQSDPNVHYRLLLSDKIAEGVQKAAKNLAPARIGWGVGKDATQVFNRRWKMKPGAINADPFGKTNDQVRMNPPVASPDLIEPAGPIDPDVSLLAAQTLDGKPIFALANYSLHYVGGAPGDSVSADYFGEFANQIKRMVDGDDSFVGIMSNGTSGDINNVNFREARPRQTEPMGQIRVVASSVAHAAYAAYKSIEFKDWVSLAAAEKEIELGVRLPSEQDVAEAKEILEKARGRALKGTNEIYARETVLLAEYPPTVMSKLQVFRMGSLGITAIPCETFVEIGLAIKKNSPLKPTFTIELANGYNGYLPTAKQHSWGGYETWRARSSYLEVNAADKIYKTIMELLSTVAPKE